MIWTDIGIYTRDYNNGIKKVDDYNEAIKKQNDKLKHKTMHLTHIQKLMNTV